MSLERVGLIKTSLLDYPGEVAAVIFTAGCNLRCPFCQNPALTSGEIPAGFLSLEEVISFLKRRQQVIGGVCITGGEPLVHDDLNDLTDQIHDLGFKIKIDTNGTFPEKLKNVGPDFVALDIKTSPEKYNRLLPQNKNLELDLFETPTPAMPEVWPRIVRTLEWICETGIDFEVRTTVVPDLVTTEDIATISALLAGEFAGAVGKRGRYILAGYRPENALDPAFASLRPYPESVIERMAAIARARGVNCLIRPNRAPGE